MERRPNSWHGRAKVAGPRECFNSRGGDGGGGGGGGRRAAGGERRLPCRNNAGCSSIISSPAERSLRSADKDGSKPALIPLIIHHIWLGSPLPEAFARLRESWLSKHGGGGHSQEGGEDEVSGNGGKGWEMRLWTDADVDDFGLENREAFEAAGNFGQKSDILRYEILLRYGGLYVDVDFLCIKSFDDLHRRYEFYAGVSNTGTFEMNNGLLGCRPDHPIMRDIVNRIRESCSLPHPVGRPRPSPSSSPPAVAAAAGENEGSGCWSDDEHRSEGEIAVVGDPLSALLGTLGEGGGRTGAGASAGAGAGLLADLLGGEDRACLEEAVQVEPGSATETIVKTGPGMFTRAVMNWMVAAADTATAAAADAGRECEPSSIARPEDQSVCCNASATSIATARYENPGTRAGGGDAVDGGKIDAGRSSGSSGEATAGAGASAAAETSGGSGSPSHHQRDEIASSAPAAASPVVMILPPSYLYPVPNNAVAAKDGALIGDGLESGILERIGNFISPETLAAHLWGRSWQGNAGMRKAS